MTTTLTTLPLNTSLVILSDLAAIEVPSHPASLILDDDYSFTKEEILASEDLKQFVLDGLGILDCEGDIIDVSNADDNFGDLSTGADGLPDLFGINEFINNIGEYHVTFTKEFQAASYFCRINGTPCTYENIINGTDNGNGTIIFPAGANSNFNYRASTVESLKEVGEYFEITTGATAGFSTRGFAVTTDTSIIAISGANDYRVVLPQNAYQLVAQDGGANGRGSGGTWRFTRTIYGFEITRNGVTLYTSPETCVNYRQEPLTLSQNALNSGFTLTEQELDTPPIQPIVSVATGMYRLDTASAIINVGGTDTAFNTGFDLTQPGDLMLRFMASDGGGTAREWESGFINVDRVIERFNAGDAVDGYQHVFDNDYFIINIVNPATGEFLLREVGRDVGIRAELWLAAPSTSSDILLDEDDLVSDSDQRGATQQSVKAYVDVNVHDVIHVADDASRLALTGLVKGTEIIQDDTSNQYLFDGVSLIERSESGIKDWTSAESVPVGEFRSFGAEIYYALQTNTNSNPISDDGTNWHNVSGATIDAYSIANDSFADRNNDWATLVNNESFDHLWLIQMLDAGTFDFNDDGNPLTVAAGDSIIYLYDEWVVFPVLPEQGVPRSINTVDPQTTDTDYLLGHEWENTTNGKIFKLLSLAPTPLITGSLISNPSESTIVTLAPGSLGFQVFIQSADLIVDKIRVLVKNTTTAGILTLEIENDDVAPNPVFNQPFTGNTANQILEFDTAGFTFIGGDETGVLLSSNQSVQLEVSGNILGSAGFFELDFNGGYGGSRDLLMEFESPALGETLWVELSSLVQTPYQFTTRTIDGTANFEALLPEPDSIIRIAVVANSNITPPSDKRFSVWNEYTATYVNQFIDADLPISTENETWDFMPTAGVNILAKKHYKNTPSFIRLATNGSTNNIGNRNVVNTASVAFGGLVIDEGNTLMSVSSQSNINTLFNGYVRVMYNFPQFSTGQRASLKVFIERSRAGVVTEYCHDYSYIRSASNTNRDTCQGQDIVDCQNGDIFRLRYVRNGNVANAINSEEIVTFSVEKL